MGRGSLLGGAFIEDFLRRNPAFDLDSFDPNDRSALISLGLGSDSHGPQIASLKTLSRLSRIGVRDTAAVGLAELGFDSALAITAVAEHQFVEAAQAVLAPEAARSAYARASAVRGVVTQIFGAVLGTIGSPHYRATRFFNADRAFQEFFATLPSYEDLFGGLDYLGFPAYRSIYSASAYFVDIMRMTDQYITDPNKGTIPAALTLAMRRPDLFDIPLDEERVNSLVPYQTIVNTVLAAYIRAAQNGDPDQIVAIAPYPFDAPYLRPLDEARRYLAAAGGALADLYKAFAAAVNAGLVTAATATSVSLASSASAVSGAYAGMAVRIVGGAAVGSSAMITSYDGATRVAIVDPPWTTAPNITSSYYIEDRDDVARETLTLSVELAAMVTTPVSVEANLAAYYGYTAVPPGGLVAALQPAQTFLERTGLTYAAAQQLLTQGLSTAEMSGGEALRLYINAVDTSLGPMQFTLDQTDPKAIFEKVSGLSLARLDRISRFVRLSSATGFAYADLDWAMKSANASELSDAFLRTLADIDALAALTPGSIPVLTAFWFDIKTTGRGNAKVPGDLFDTIFNAPAVLAGKSPYNDPTVPFNPASAQIWTVASRTGADLVLRNRLIAALNITDNDLTTLATYLLALSGNASGTTITLDVAHLSWFFRLAKSAAFAKVSIDDYLTLLAILYYPTAGRLAPPANAWKPTPAELIRQRTIVTIVRSSGFTIADLAFILSPVNAAGYSPGFRDPEVVAFINDLATLTKPSFVSVPSLNVADVDEPLARRIFDALVTAQNITAAGIVLNPAAVSATFAQYVSIAEDAFESADIDSDSSKLVFGQLAAAVPPVILTAGLGATRGALSPAFDAQTPLPYIFPTDPGKRLEVQAVLLLAKAKVDAIARTVNEVLATADVAQEKATTEGLSTFLHVSAATLLHLVDFNTGEKNLRSFRVSMLTVITNAVVPPDIAKLLAQISPSLVWVRKLTFSDFDLSTLISIPAAFNIVNPHALAIDDIASLITFRSLVTGFGDTTNGFTKYLRTPTTSGLTAVTGWVSEQVTALEQHFWPLSGIDTAAGPGTVAGVARLKRSFDISDSTGGDIYLLLALDNLSDLPAMQTAADVQTLWPTYTAASNAARAVLASNHDQATFPAILKPLDDAVSTARRDVFLGYTLRLLNATYPDITTPGDLYAFFLIDVEMSACNDTSWIAQGISSVQLYMQRCRMNLETGVNDLTKIGPTWWSWMQSYRIWEANRKIFLYPENYIDPRVRSTATPLFTNFADELTQSPATDDSVSAAYRSYFDELAQLANLVHVTAYNATVNGTDRLYLVGRTATTPYEYYYRTCDAGAIWRPWQKIDLTITAPVVSPAHAFGRLALGWNQTQTITNSAIEGSVSVDRSVSQTSVMFAVENANGTWSPQQTANASFTVNILDDYAPTSYIDTNFPLFESILNPAISFWNAPYLLPVRASSFKPLGPSDQLFIDTGYSYRFMAGVIVPIPASPPSSIGNPDIVAFEGGVYDFVARINAVALATKPFTNYSGYVRLSPTVTIDANFIPNSIFTDITYFLEFNPQAYAPNIDRVGGTFGVIAIPDVLYGDYYYDSFAMNPTPFNAAPTLALLSNISTASSSTFSVKNQPGWSIFNNGDEAFLVQLQLTPLNKISDILTASTSTPPLPAGTYLYVGPYTTAAVPPPASLSYAFTRLSTVTVNRLISMLTAGGTDRLFTIDAQTSPELKFSRFYPGGVRPTNVIAPTSDQLDFRGAYGPYFREIFFHAPFLVAAQLGSNRQFDAARKWFEHIFDPTYGPDPTAKTDVDRFWRYLPFRDLTIPTLQEDLSDPAQIARYHDSPFDPDAIADIRPGVYPKSVVMHYIDNLINDADDLFRSDTREAIDAATGLYVIASDILGPRPHQVGELPAQPTKTFAQIKADYPAGIPEFLIELETTELARVDYSLPVFPSNPINDINAYFCVPDNDNLIAYWDRVEDRLFKIRHCMNIDGVVRPLALFAPPIDPGSLIGAMGAGGGPRIGGGPVAPIPAYRFTVVVERAKAFAGAVVSLGSALLGALEKRDAEALALLRNANDKVLLDMTTSAKIAGVNEALETLASLNAALDAANARSQYYGGLISTGISPDEQQSLDALESANKYNILSAAFTTAAAVGFAVPQFGSPFAMTYGGQQIGSVLTSVASGLQIGAIMDNYTAERSATMGSYARRAQEWAFQLAAAGYDITQITQQVNACADRVTIVKREYDTHIKSIAQTVEIDTFMRGKFTSEQLYSWMISQIAGIYFQAYTMAIDLARGAQRAFAYETNSTQTFIDFSYWENLKKGLLAGESLQLSLGQMEKAYFENGGRYLEIQKTISLTQLDPLAMMALRRSGECTFSLPEVLYDFDYPGHYNRKIKGMTISVPAVLGPYQNVNATLTQLSNQIAIAPNAKAIEYLLGLSGTDTPPSDTVRTDWWVNQSIALSTGNRDTGLFSFDFNDPRYLPFEGTGAVSTWRLSMPKLSNRIDFSSVSDVVIQVSYTAKDGGAKLRGEVLGFLEQLGYAGSASMSLAHNFPDAWFAFINDHSHPGQSQTLTFPLSTTIVPPHVADAALVSMFLVLVVAGDVGALPRVQFLTVNIASYATPILPMFDVNNASQYTFSPQPAIDAVCASPETIVFNLATTPPLPLLSGGFIDPAKLLDVLIVLDYHGDVRR